jgi:hypothetical protein
LSRLGRVVKQNGVAFLALAVALSGTAYAASKIGPNDIKRNAIRSQHIKAGQVKLSDLAGDIRQELSAAGGQLDVKVVNGAPLFLAPGEFDGAPVAQCPAGYVVVGTGFDTGVGEPGFVLAFGTFVGGFFANFSSITTETSVQAICARDSAAGATTASAAELRKFERMVSAEREAIESGAGG